MGGAAPGLPEPETLEIEWSSSSSEESPEYATKPVLNFFATGSERGRSRRESTEDRANRGVGGERGQGSKGEKQTPKNSNQKMQRIKLKGREQQFISVEGGGGGQRLVG